MEDGEKLENIMPCPYCGSETVLISDFHGWFECLFCYTVSDYDGNILATHNRNIVKNY